METTLEYRSRSTNVGKCEGVRLMQDAIVEFWPEMERQLRLVPQIWDMHWTPDIMREALMAGQWQAWGFGPPGVIRVTVFTHIAGFPAGRVLQIPIAFGNSIDAMLPVIEATFERFAQEHDCTYCEIYGRPGWERKLDGFKRVATVLRRKVVKSGVH